jgi:hypothetical protein
VISTQEFQAKFSEGIILKAEDASGMSFGDLNEAQQSESKGEKVVLDQL